MAFRMGKRGWLSGICGLLLGALVASVGNAESQEDLARKRDEKQDRDFFYRGAWEVDYPHALARARHWKKPLFAYFTRSDRPDPIGEEIEDRVFVSDEFVELSESLSLYCNLYSGVEGDPQQGLLFEKQGGAWPYIAILDAKGRVLAVHEGEVSVKGIRETLARAKKFSSRLKELETRSEKGDREASIELTRVGLERGHFSSRVARGRIEALGDLSDEESVELERLINRTELVEIFCAFTRGKIALGDAVEKVRGFLGKRSDSSLAAMAFWDLLVERVIAKEDPVCGRKVVECLESLSWEAPALEKERDRLVEALRAHFGEVGRSSGDTGAGS